MKKNILIFCSWLDTNSLIGIFFREQALLVTEEFNPLLVVFKKMPLNRLYINIKKNLKIIEKKTIENLTVLEVLYPYHRLLPKKINNYFEKLALESLYNYMKCNNIKVSLIHAQSLFDAGIWAYHYATKFRIPYIVTEHNQLSFFNVERDKCELIRKTLQKSELNLVVSNDKIRQFIANGLYFKFENIGNLINKNFYYKAKNHQNIQQRLVTIGAFTYLKDQETLLKALRLVDKKISNRIEFTWIGYDGWGGNHDINVKALLANFQFENIDIILIPLLSRDEIAGYLQSSDLFLFSSLTEGMPVSVLEALACGLPVFTTNCGGVDEIINEGNGVIYQIKDFVKLSDLIFDFLNHKLHYNNITISKQIIDRFGEDVFREKLLSIYKNVK
ncbi:MAG: glycosyltransferase family 4 protein [Lutibacter sp.]|nr:glycosyltransferase family 4 protein [Lutibacter sp.]